MKWRSYILLFGVFSLVFGCIFYFTRIVQNHELPQGRDAENIAVNSQGVHNVGGSSKGGASSLKPPKPDELKLSGKVALRDLRLGLRNSNVVELDVDRVEAVFNLLGVDGVLEVIKEAPFIDEDMELYNVLSYFFGSVASHSDVKELFSFYAELESGNSKEQVGLLLRNLTDAGAIEALRKLLPAVEVLEDEIDPLLHSAAYVIVATPGELKKSLAVISSEDNPTAKLSLKMGMVSADVGLEDGEWLVERAQNLTDLNEFGAELVVELLGSTESEVARDVLFEFYQDSDPNLAMAADRGLKRMIENHHRLFHGIDTKYFRR